MVTVGARGVLEIPFSFRPLEMAQACGHVIVEIHEEGSPIDGIKWQYPIKGEMSIWWLLMGPLEVRRYKNAILVADCRFSSRHLGWSAWKTHVPNPFPH